MSTTPMTLTRALHVTEMETGEAIILSEVIVEANEVQEEEAAESEVSVASEVEEMLREEIVEVSMEAMMKAKMAPLRMLRVNHTEEIEAEALFLGVKEEIEELEEDRISVLEELDNIESKEVAEEVKQTNNTMKLSPNLIQIKMLRAAKKN